MGLLTSSATVVCAALNFRASVDALADSFTHDPYKKPPLAPILYLKPFNTFNGDRGVITCPPNVETLRMGGTLGIVIGRPACRVQSHHALRYVYGYCILNDVSIPHASYYRPAIKERCFDGSLVIGNTVPAADIANPNALPVHISLNGALVCRNSTANLVRSVEQLIADVTEFMTLAEGDILAVGEPDNAPLARHGDTVIVEIPGLGLLHNRIEAAER